MAELKTVEGRPNGCCSPAAQETCCEPRRSPNAASTGTQTVADAALVAREGDDVQEHVRSRYAAAAVAASDGGQSSCGPAAVITDEQRDSFGAELYDGNDLGALPDAAKLASLGCGNPTAVADLREGETVLDLGPAVGSMCCCPPGASGPRVRPTDLT